MAADAKVQKVEELAAYSNHLGGFIESMSKNFISFNNVMMQKLEELRKKLRKAEEMCAEATTECSQCERDLAYCSSDNNEVKRNLKIRLDYAINKRLDAQQMRSLVSSQYNVAQGVLRCMFPLALPFFGIGMKTDLLHRAPQNSDLQLKRTVKGSDGHTAVLESPRGDGS